VAVQLKMDFLLEADEVAADLKIVLRFYIHFLHLTQLTSCIEHSFSQEANCSYVSQKLSVFYGK